MTTSLLSMLIDLIKLSAFINSSRSIRAGKANGKDSHAKTSIQSRQPEYFCLKWLQLCLRVYWVVDGYDKAEFVTRGKNVYSEPHSFVGCYMRVYCTQFVSTNKRRAAFVLTNPIEVLRRRRRRRRNVDLWQRPTPSGPLQK